MRARRRLRSERRDRAAADDPRALIPRVLARPARGDGAALRRAVGERLLPAAGDAVLEVGCGDGRMLLELVARTPNGLVVGVEPDPWMVRHATARTRPLIECGRVRILTGRSSDLSALPDGAFDKACAVDVVYFWREPARDLAEIRRVLRPGGRLLLGYVAPPSAVRLPGHDLMRGVDEVEGWLRAAGFDDVTTVHRHDGSGREALRWTVAAAPAPAGPGGTIELNRAGGCGQGARSRSAAAAGPARHEVSP